MDSSQRALQTNGKLYFKFVFELMAGNRKIFKRIARRDEYCSKCNVLNIYQ